MGINVKGIHEFQQSVILRKGRKGFKGWRKQLLLLVKQLY